MWPLLSGMLKWWKRSLRLWRKEEESWECICILGWPWRVTTVTQWKKSGSVKKRNFCSLNLCILCIFGYLEKEVVIKGRCQSCWRCGRYSSTQLSGQQQNQRAHRALWRACIALLASNSSASLQISQEAAWGGARLTGISSRDGCFYLETSVHQQSINVSALRYFIGASCSQNVRQEEQHSVAGLQRVFVVRQVVTLLHLCVSLTDAFRYLLIFLKFVQAVIPTIEYDYTRHFTM